MQPSNLVVPFCSAASASQARRAVWSAARKESKLTHRRGLVFAYASGGDLRAKVVFSANGTAGHPAQDGDLSRMCQRIRYRPLEELFRGSAERLRGSQVFV